VAAKKSQAWKDHERGVTQDARDAGFTLAYRVLRGDDIGISDVDVILPEIPQARIDCKYTQGGWAHHTKFFDCEKKYVVKGSGQFLILPTKSKGQQGSLSTIRTEVLMGLLAKTYLARERPAGTLGCPACPGIARAAEPVLGLSLCTCTNCGLSYMLQASSVPANANALADLALNPPVPAGEPLPLEAPAIEVEATVVVPKATRTRKTSTAPAKKGKLVA
jgi:hypothetical protein